MNFYYPENAAVEPDGSGGGSIVPPGGVLAVSQITNPDATSSINLPAGGAFISIVTNALSGLTLNDAFWGISIAGVNSLGGLPGNLLAYVDMTWQTAAIGPVLLDTVTGDRYRIKVSSGVLGVTGPL